MLDLSRREILAGTVATTVLSSAAPTALFAQAAATSGTAAWDLRDIFPTDAAWETERQSIMAAIPGLKTYQGKLGDGASLKAALQAGSDLNRRASRLYSYASLKADEDRRVGANQERKQKAQDVFTAIGEATAWSSPEIGRASCRERVYHPV